MCPQLVSLCSPSLVAAHLYLLLSARFHGRCYQHRTCVPSRLTTATQASRLPTASLRVLWPEGFLLDTQMARSPQGQLSTTEP